MFPQIQSRIVWWFSVLTVELNLPGLSTGSGHQLCDFFNQGIKHLQVPANSQVKQNNSVSHGVKY